MRTFFGVLRADFLSYQKLLRAIFLQKKLMIQALAASMLMVSIVKICL